MVACDGATRYILCQKLITGSPMRASAPRFLVLGAVLVSLVAGCGLTQRLGFNRAEPEVQLPFRSKLSKGDQDRRFTVQVAAQGADIDAVRESVRHPATGFCLLNFGGSDIDWNVDASGEWQALRDDGGDLTFSGTCAKR